MNAKLMMPLPSSRYRKDAPTSEYTMKLMRKGLMAAATVALICVFCSVFANWIAPHDPFDLATLELSDARLPPAWSAEGSSKYLLGTDDQGRDILSALMYGARISLVVGLVSVALSVLVGGLTAQIERSAPSAGPALETQVASLVWQVMCSTGVDHPPVVALVQALDRGVTQALGTDAQATARACIRGGLVLALGRYYGELKPGLLPIAGGDAAMEARISDMLEASKAALLQAVDSQATD